MKKTAFYLILFLLSSLPAFASRNNMSEMLRKMPEFSAVMTVYSGGNTQSMKFYYTKKKQRTEPIGKSAGSSIIITRLDKDVVWMLMPKNMKYMEMKFNQKNSNPLTSGTGAVKTERIGEDTINGHKCVKYKVTTKDENGERRTMYEWVAKDLGWPIQAEALDGSWRYTFTNIKVGRQDPALFEIPGGYERLERPSARDFVPA
ncbi:MAG: DUF4412 domain-containing protein, partial [Nitrospirota bacterium]